MVTYQPPPLWLSIAACAPSTLSPVRAAGPRRTGRPSSSSTTRPPSGSGSALGEGDGDAEGSGVGVASGTPSTGWNVSWAVRPMTSAASRGSCTPGSSTMIRRSPERARLGSETPRASTRRRSTSRARSVDSRSAFTVGESWVSRTIWVPPRRSRPRRAGVVTAKNSDAARTPRAIRARMSGACDTRDLPGRWAASGETCCCPRRAPVALGRAIRAARCPCSSGRRQPPPREGEQQPDAGQGRRQVQPSGCAAGVRELGDVPGLHRHPGHALWRLPERSPRSRREGGGPGGGAEARRAWGPVREPRRQQGAQERERPRRRRPAAALPPGSAPARAPPLTSGLSRRQRYRPRSPREYP